MMSSQYVDEAEFVAKMARCLHGLDGYDLLDSFCRGQEYYLAGLYGKDREGIKDRPRLDRMALENELARRKAFKEGE